MNSACARLMKWADEKKVEIVESGMKLIRENNPNRFSVLQGKLEMIEEVQDKLLKMEKEEGPEDGITYNKG